MYIIGFCIFSLVSVHSYILQINIISFFVSLHLIQTLPDLIKLILHENLIHQGESTALLHKILLPIINLTEKLLVYIKINSKFISTQVLWCEALCLTFILRNYKTPWQKLLVLYVCFNSKAVIINSKTELKTTLTILYLKLLLHNDRRHADHRYNSLTTNSILSLTFRFISIDLAYSKSWNLGFINLRSSHIYDNLIVHNCLHS